MPLTIDNRDSIIRDLIADNWSNSGLPVSLTPARDIHTGWYDGSRPLPQISVSNPEDSPNGGGETGITGIAPGGTRVSEQSGTVLVNVWAGADDPVDGVYADDIAKALDAVVVDILWDALDGGATALHTIGVGQRRGPFADPDDTPVEWRIERTVPFHWTKRE